MTVSSRSAPRKSGFSKSSVCGCFLCSILKNGSDLSLLSADIYFTRHVPSNNVEVAGNLRLGLELFFVYSHSNLPNNQPPHPHFPKHKRIQENYCAVLLSGKGRHVTKY